MFCSFNTCFHQMCSHQTWELWKYWRRKEAWSKILVFLLCRLWLQWVSPSPHSVPKPRQPRRGWDTQCVLWHWIHVHHSIHLLWSSEFFSALSKLSAALWLMTGSNSITNSLFYHHRHSHSSARPIFLWKYSFFFCGAGHTQGYRSTFGVSGGELRPAHLPQLCNSLWLRGQVMPASL